MATKRPSTPKSKLAPRSAPSPSKAKTPRPAAQPASMARSSKQLAAPRAGALASDPAVEAFMRDLEHPLKAQFQALRQLIRGVSPEVTEEIKWNVPSFRTSEHFATFNLRGKAGLRLILHTGAKVRASATTGVEIADPDGLLEWLAKDRAMVTIRDADDLQTRGPALQSLLRAWIRLL